MTLLDKTGTLVGAEVWTQKSSSQCLASWAASVHMSNFSSTRTPKPSAGLFSVISPSLPPCLGLPWPRWNSWTSWHSRVSHGPTSQAGHKFLVIAKLPKTHSLPLSVLAMKVLKSTSPRALRDTTHHGPPPGHRAPDHLCIHSANSSPTEQSTLPSHISPMWS